MRSTRARLPAMTVCLFLCWQVRQKASGSARSAPAAAAARAACSASTGASCSSPDRAAHGLCTPAQCVTLNSIMINHHSDCSLQLITYCILIYQLTKIPRKLNKYMYNLTIVGPSGAFPLTKQVPFSPKETPFHRKDTSFPKKRPSPHKKIGSFS